MNLDPAPQHPIDPDRRMRSDERKRELQLHPQLRPGFDLAVIIRGTIEELPSSDAARDLLQDLLRRARLLADGMPTPGAGAE